MNHISHTVDARAVVTAREHEHLQPARYGSVLSFLFSRGGAEWVLLLYPVFVFFVFRQRGDAEVSSIDNSVLLQVGMTGACGLYAMHRLVNRGALIWQALTGTPLAWLVAYCILAVASTAWSGIPELTLFRGGQNLIFLVLVVDAVLSSGHIQNLIKLQLCYSCVVTLFWQFSLLQHNVSLAALHSSQIPGAVIGTVFTGWLLQGRQWRLVYLIVVSMVVLGTSAATYVSLLAGLAAALVTAHRRVGEGAILIVFLAAMAFAFPNESRDLVFYGKKEGNIRTASGRLPTWEWLVKRQMQERPYVGFGFGYGEVQARLYNNRGLRMQNMHSAAMSALVNLGLTGAALLGCFWISIANRVRRWPGSPTGQAVLGAVIAVTLNSLAVSSVTSPLSFAWIGHLLIYAIPVFWNPQTIVAHRIRLSQKNRRIADRGTDR